MSNYMVYAHVHLPFVLCFQILFKLIKDPKSIKDIKSRISDIDDINELGPVSAERRSL